MKKTNKSRRKVCVFTASRAEFGLLRGTMDALRSNPRVRLQVIASGTHFSRAHGHTVREIEEAGFRIDARLSILSGGDSRPAVCNSMGRALAGCGRIFDRLRPDVLLVLGDRFETFCAVAAAVVSGVPVAHVHGGETSEGTMDEMFRHAITKLSHLHFASCADYARRIMRMGEDPARVFVVGAPGIENIRRLSTAPAKEVAAAIGFDPREPFLLVTMHPATYDSDGGLAAADAMLAALDAFPELHVVLTSANADPGGSAVNRRLRAYAARRPGRCHLRSSLGHRLYLAALARCRAVVGNSSSGIIEAPSLGVPTVNIGDRQRGRLRAASVIDCAPDVAGVVGGIRRALSAPFRRRLSHAVNPYEGRAPGRMIARVIAGYPLAKLGPKVFNESCRVGTDVTSRRAVKP